jgi:bacterioferritin-associated ferredoxin
MVVCSCNFLTDTQIFALVAGAHQHQRPPTVSQVYAGLGCRAQCGRCAPTVKKLRDDACGAKAEAAL